MAARVFVEELRLKKFGIGSREDSPLAHKFHETIRNLSEGFHEAIRNLSEGLYQKEIHFLLEILQNVEDNSYPKGVPPSLEIILTDKDITETGASGTLVFFNNEVGFSEKNIEALCSIGRSTKKSNKAEGYIGEKGIGFKSVFLVSGRPHIISNGFRIRFHDEPDNEAGLGYVVPEWTEKPIDQDLALLYGSRNVPSTVLVLPLRHGKLEGVAKQLAQISPESLLFLSKLSKLSIRDELQGKSTALSRTVETAETHRGNSKSFTTVLSVESCGRSRETSYYMFIEKVRVPDSSKIASRKGVDEWTITLAFPFEDVVWPSQIGSTYYGNVFSFLPTEVQSQFPFLINADFILTSSREAIAWENVWNQGILNLIPGSFCDAFENLLKKDPFGGQSTIGTARLYEYIPTSRSCPSLEKVRLDIVENLKLRQIVLCASEFLEESNIHFCRASDARTVIRTFRDILKQAISMNIQSPLVGGRLKFVNQFVEETQTSALSALKVQSMSVTEYIELMPPWWIQSLPDELYAKLLSFLAFDLEICNRDNMASKSFKFLKYKDYSTGEIKYASILDRNNAANEPICLSSGDQKSSWLSIWADVLSGWITFHVMPQRFLSVLNDQTYSRLLYWLKNSNLNVISITPQTFAEKLISVAVQNSSHRLALISMHFFFDMEQKGLLLNTSLKGRIPLLDCLGSLQLQTSNKQILLPPSLSQWPLLMKPETWADVTKLSDQYLEEQCRMVDLSSMESFRSFLERKLDAIDVLQLYPLNQNFPTEGLARKEAAMLFLEWIKIVLKKLGHLPREFSNSVASNSCWVQTDHGPRSPSRSFLLVEEIQKFFVRGDLPFVDTEYYGCVSHRHEWEAIGVHTVPSEEECYMGAVIEHFQSLMTSPASEMYADKATRFYTYLSSFKHCQNLENLLPTIWIPRTRANSSPSWIAAKKCLISDEDRLFETKYSILGTFYNSKNITSFFHKKLGVPLKPGIEHYIELWLDWTKEARNVTDWECLKAWTVLAAEDCVEFRKSPMWSRFLNEASIPSTLMGKKGTITLLHPSKTLVPDDLEMEHLFQASSPSPPMAWWPKSQVCKLSTLFSIYNSMGAQNLSECVQNETDMGSISTSEDIFSDILWPIQPLITPELFKLVMGLVSKELSAHERKKVLLPLLTAKEMVMNEGLKLKHSLCIGEQTFTTSSEVLVFWLRSSNIIYHVERGQLKDALSRMRFDEQLAKTISHGLLSERREMAEVLQQRLSTANLCDLDSSVVDFMLRNMNIPFFEDDMSFIQNKRLEDAPSTKLEEDSAASTPLESLTKRCNDSDEDEIWVNALSKTVDKSRIGSSSETLLEPLLSQLNISAGPVTSTLITFRMEGIGLVKQQEGNAGIPSRRRSNSGNTNILEKEKLQLELLHEIRGALLGEGKKIPIAIDESVEPALGWYKAQLLSVRHFLGYPPEPGSVKRGMKVMDLQGDPFDLDKCLFLAFAHPMISSNVQFGTIHERLTTLGRACLNMWITYELLDKHPEQNMGAIVGKREKMMSRVLCSHFLRASQLNMCLVGADSCDDPKILSDVFMAIMGVGYLCYECGLDEVRRLYLEVFVESLEAASSMLVSHPLILSS